MIWYVMIWYIYLTAIGLTTGGCNTSHIYIQTIHIIQRKVNWEVRAVSRVCELYPGICLTTEKEHGKTSVRVAQYKNNEAQYKSNESTRTMIQVRQKYLTIWQISYECNRWRVEFVLERSSSETQSISGAMERWSLEHRAFAVETYLKNNDFVVVTQRIFRRHFYVTGTTVSLVAILYCCGWETAQQCHCIKNIWSCGAPNIALGLNFHPYRHYIQEVNIAIKRLWDKVNISNKFT
jgi:hypothetical protein